MDEEQRHEQTTQGDDGPEPTPSVDLQQADPIEQQTSTQGEQAKKFHWNLTGYEIISILIQGSIFFAIFVYMIFAGL
jgi:hypothetical protein